MAEGARHIPGTLQDRLDDIRQRISRACQRAGRRAEEVTLVAVTKNFPIETIQAAIEAGLTDFGENRVQEFVEKAERIPGQVMGGEVTWHMIGHLQRNKAREVARLADRFHALDSHRLARELEKRAAGEDRVLPCLIQVNTSGETTKSGVDPGEVDHFLGELMGLEHLRIEGLMTIAAFTNDPEEVRSEFRTLRELLERCQTISPLKSQFNKLSMGMSNDFEVAIEEGATHVRIGSALFGERPY